MKMRALAYIGASKGRKWFGKRLMTKMLLSYRLFHGSNESYLLYRISMRVPLFHFIASKNNYELKVRKERFFFQTTPSYLFLYFSYFPSPLKWVLRRSINRRSFVSRSMGPNFESFPTLVD